MSEGKWTRAWIIGSAAVLFWGVVAWCWTLRGKSAVHVVHVAHVPAAPAPGTPATPMPVPATPAPPAPERAGHGKIQVALLLDTSGSMNGLIDQARSQLWKVVSQLDQARRNGQRPRLEIAVYEYGNPATATAESGWIRRVLPFSNDLDAVSEALFALTTSGGDEYVGQVVQTATRELAWSPAASDVKMIFVAGNEPFDQGPVAPDAAIAAARKKGITVNAIVCGGDDPTWVRGARLARTDLLVIDHNAAPVHVASPQDAEIERLGVVLNSTYLAYGVEGAHGLARQAQQDANSAGAQAGYSTWRSIAKSRGNYRNDVWDLGDAVQHGTVALEKLDAQQLPEVMRGMSMEERKAYVQKKLDERTRLQKRIQELSVERDGFVAKERAKQLAAGGSAASSLDLALMNATRKQASAAGLTFE